MSETIDIDNTYRGELPAVRLAEISIVIPVRNNARGVDRFLRSFFASHRPQDYPGEIVIVDNNSDVPLALDPEHLRKGLPIKLRFCSAPGPAAARNLGAREASGEWLLFCDSDCIPTSSLLAGYLEDDRRAVAWAGSVKATPASYLSRYYDDEEILIPRRKTNRAGEQVPLYLVTANALVWKRAFDECGRFDESFRYAGGEDVDLARRLWQVGNIAYQPRSEVLHDFSDGWPGFCRRFVRYGRGNRRVEEATRIVMRPRLRRPRRESLLNRLTMVVHYACMSIGYYGEKYRARRRAKWD